MFVFGLMPWSVFSDSVGIFRAFSVKDRIKITWQLFDVFIDANFMKRTSEKKTGGEVVGKENNSFHFDENNIIANRMWLLKIQHVVQFTNFKHIKELINSLQLITFLSKTDRNSSSINKLLNKVLHNKLQHLKI